MLSRYSIHDNSMHAIRSLVFISNILNICRCFACSSCERYNDAREEIICLIKKMGNTAEFTKWIFIYFYIIQFTYARRILEEPRVHFLNVDDSVENNNPGLKTYCHNATSKYLIHIWRTMTMHLDINSDSYVLYDGKTPPEIYQKHSENQRSWSFNFFDTTKHKKLKINPFENTCIGIYVDSSSESGYIIRLTDTRVNVWKLTMMIIGIIIFFCAQILSRNSIFYYACGILFGVTMSLLILIYLAGKLVPKGKTMYLLFAGTISLYLVRTLLENTQLIAMQYKEWVMWYMLVTSLISFVICYRFGPVTNDRTKRIIQWFLQLIGLLLVYKSSYFLEASISCCILLILLYNFPKVALERGKSYWLNMFPEKRKLLTEDQYRLEGIRETRKALKELQDYCSSPECNTWKTILKIKHPIRFARFVEGGSHLEDDEIEEHDVEVSKIIEEYSDDDFY